MAKNRDRADGAIVHLTFGRNRGAGPNRPRDRENAQDGQGEAKDEVFPACAFVAQHRAAGFRDDPHTVVRGCHDRGLGAGAGQEGRDVMRLKGERGSARGSPPRRASRGKPDRGTSPAPAVSVCKASPSSLWRAATRGKADEYYHIQQGPSSKWARGRGRCRSSVAEPA